MRILTVFISVFVLIFSASCRNQDDSSQDSNSSPSSPKTNSTKSELRRSYFLKHDFGIVDAGQKMSCSLEMKNDSDQPMHFGFNSTSCGSCLAVKSMPQKIEPDESGIFELDFDPTGKRGATLQNAYFWDTDPKTLLVVVDVTATVPAVWTDPEMIDLGNLSASEPLDTKLYVLAAGLPNAKVVSVKCDAPWLSLTSKPLKSPNILVIDYYEILWTGIDANPGDLSSKITFCIQKGDEEQSLSVGVSGYLSGDVDVIPAQIVFGRMSKDAVTRTCLLSFPDFIDGSKIRCSADHDSITISLTQSQDDQEQYVLTACMTPPSTGINGLIEGAIVGTDEAGKIVFSVPYIAFRNNDGQ